MRPKNEAAAALGRARWAKVPPEERTKHAKKAIAARWAKTPKKPKPSPR